MAFFGLTTNKNRNRERKRARSLQSELNRVRSEEGPDQNAVRQQANVHATQMRQTANEGREEGRKRGEEFNKRQFSGLSAEERNRHESDASRRINREVQRNQRELIGKQGHHGLRGGSAYAQKADLARLGHEAHNEAQSAIRGMDSDLALKNKANQFAIEEGGAAENVLNHQSAVDQINLQNERKRQRRNEASLFNLIRG